ncbi:MAG TPA: NIL domain-containing protein [Dehalococcoidia bacterium]|jgi:ABC-type methionine transport system ATPase subunit|nr:NIL domain-containing protein [Dehalococcoidia bacterium]
MAKLRVKFTFPQDKIKDPVIWEVGRRFELVTNIRRADVTPEIAWAVLELEGEADEIERALNWVTETGVRVDPVEDSIIEG